jgi:tetratricopeptide (TPR) repeat protein
LGLRYAALGQIRQAIKYHEQALAIAREIGARQVEVNNLCDLAETLIDAGRYAEAIDYASESINIVDEIGSPGLGSNSNGYLAFAYFFSGDLSGARAAAEAARQYEVSLNNHTILALLGVIALRQGDRGVALEAFAAAVTQADALLAHSAQNYTALDSKALALCGLALCEGGQHISDAIAAYQAARSINNGAGVVKRAVRLLDALALVDTKGILAEVRPAAGGQALT